jgi:hypothetical protein
MPTLDPNVGLLETYGSRVRTIWLFSQLGARLADLFAGDIKNPAEPDEILNAGWTHEHRRAAIKAANEMHEELDSVINHCYLPDVAVRRMQSVFGERIPNRPDLVGVHSAAVAAVAAAPATIVPAPEVGRSSSG